MLADKYVVVQYAAKCVAIGLARKILASRCRPGWRGHLKNKPLARVIPRNHSLRMSPRSTALLGTPFDFWIVIQLVIPYDIVVVVVVYLAECGAYGVDACPACTTAPLLKLLVRAAREHILLSKCLVVLNFSAKWTVAIRATRK